MKKLLIACEYSGIVRDAFLKQGVDGISCDILPTESPGPHHMGYLEDYIGDGSQWAGIIAFPPCTYLTSVGLHWNGRISGRAEKSEYALAFVQMIMNRDCKFICIENPVGLISTRIRKPDQTIHPYYFGDNEMKRTCLWLTGLPKLIHPPVPDLVKPEPTYINKSGKKLYFTDAISGSNGGGHIRSKTFPGIANAMALQWSQIIKAA